MSFRGKKAVLKGCKIFQMLKKSARGKHFAFHMPGHKQGKWDITELSYSDNLASPRGCIAEAEEDIAHILGAKKSFLLTDGSTSGVHAMLFAASRLGARTVAVPTQAHRSVVNGCKLAGLTPIFYGEGGKFTAAQNADAALVVSPDYFGKIADLATLRAYCDGEGKLLLVDGAHGGHLHFQKELYAGGYADFWVDGVHKTLPALTQGAVVSARTEQGAAALFEGVNTFRTTSPSYPIMASVEYAVKYPRNERLENAVCAYMTENAHAAKVADWTKLSIDFGARAKEVADELERRGIFAELCEEGKILFYLSPVTKLRHFKKLKREIAKMERKYPYLPIAGKNKAQRVPTPLVFPKNGQTEWVPLHQAEGKICAADCGLFPPCAPLLLRGERVDQARIEKLTGGNVYGLWKGKICVFINDSEEV